MAEMLTAINCCFKSIRFWSVCQETPCSCSVAVDAEDTMPVFWSGIPCASRMEVQARVDDVTHGTVYIARIFNETDDLKNYEYTVNNEGGAGPDQYVWQVAEALAALINAASDDFDTPITAAAFRTGFVRLNAGEVPIRADFLKNGSTMTDHTTRWPTPAVTGPCTILGGTGTYDTETAGGVSRVSNFAGFSCWTDDDNLPPCTANEFSSAVSGKAVLVVDSKVYVWRAKVSRLTVGTNYAVTRTTQIGVLPPVQSDVVYITTASDEEGTRDELAQQIANAINAAWGGDGYVASAPGEGWVEIHHSTGHRRFGNDSSTFKIINDGYSDEIDSWAADSIARYGIDMTGWDDETGQQNARLMDANLGEEVFEHTLAAGIDEQKAWAYASAFNAWVANTPEFKGFRGVKACRVYGGPMHRGEVETYSPSPTALYLGATASDQDGTYNGCRVVVVDEDTDTFDITVTKFQSAVLTGFVGSVDLAGGTFSGSVTVTYHYNVSSCDESDEFTISQTISFGNSPSTVLTFNRFNPEDVDAPEGTFVNLVSVAITVTSEVGAGSAEVTRGSTGTQVTGSVDVTQGVTLTSDAFPDFDVDNDVSEPVTMDVGVGDITVSPDADSTGPVSVPLVSVEEVTSVVQAGTISDYDVTGLVKLATIAAPGWTTPPVAGSKFRIYRHVRVQFASSNTSHPDDLEGDQPDKGVHNPAHPVIFWARNGNLTSDGSQTANAWTAAGTVRKCCGPLHGSTYAVRFAGSVLDTDLGDLMSPPSVAYDVTASITVDNPNTTGGCKGDGPDDTVEAIAIKWIAEFDAVKSGIPVEARPTATHTGNGVILLEGPVYVAENPAPLPPDTAQEFETAGAFNFHAEQPDSAWLGFSVIQGGTSGAAETDTVWYYDGMLAEIPYRPFVGWPYLGSSTEWHAANIADANIVGAEYAVDGMGDPMDCTDDPPPDPGCPGWCDECVALDNSVTISGTVTWPGGVSMVINITAPFAGCDYSGFDGLWGDAVGFPDCETGVSYALAWTKLCPTSGYFSVIRTEVAGGGAPPCYTNLVRQDFAWFNFAGVGGTLNPGDGSFEPGGDASFPGTVSFNKGSSQWHLGDDPDCDETYEKCLPGANPLP